MSAMQNPIIAALDVPTVEQALQLAETLAPVVRLSRTPAEVRLPPPALGEHTAEVLAGLEPSHKGP